MLKLKTNEEQKSKSVFERDAKIMGIGMACPFNRFGHPSYKCVKTLFNFVSSYMYV